MAENLGTAVLELRTTQRQFNKELDGARKSADKLAGRFKRVGKAMSTAVTLPIAAAGAASAKLASEFEFSMNKVQAVTGATAKQFSMMREQALELGSTTQFSATQSAEAMQFLGMAGFETNEIMESLPATLDLAAAGAMDLSQAADIASNVMSGFGMEASEMGQAADIMTKAFTSSNTSLQELGEAFAYAGPVAKSAGISFEETAALLGTLGNAGIKATRAGTTLRAAISKLLSPSDDAAKIINDLGIQVTNSQGQMNSMVDIIKQLEQAGASTSQVMEIFGLRAGPGIQAMMEQGSDSIEELTEKLGDAGGTADRVANKMMEGLRGKFLEMKSAAEGAAIAVGNQLKPLLMDLMGAVTNLLQGFSDLNESTQRVIVVIAGLAAAIGPLALAAGGLISAISALAPLLATIGSVLLGPAGVIAAVTALGVAFSKATQETEGGEAEARKLAQEWGVVGEEARQAENNMRSALEARSRGLEKSQRHIHAMTARSRAMDEHWQKISESASSTAKANEISTAELSRQQKILRDMRQDAEVTLKDAAIHTSVLQDRWDTVKGLNNAFGAQEKIAREISGWRDKISFFLAKEKSDTGTLKEWQKDLIALYKESQKFLEGQTKELEKQKRTLGDLSSMRRAEERTRIATGPDLVSAPGTERGGGGGIDIANRVMSILGDGLMKVVNFFSRIITSAEPFVNFMDRISSVVSAALAPAIDALVNALRPFLPAIKAFANIVGNQLAGIFKSLGSVVKSLLPVIRVAGTFVQQVGNLFKALLPALKPMIDLIVTIITPLIANLSSVLMVLTPIIKVFASVFGVIVDVLDTVFKPVLLSIAAVFRAFSNILSNIFSFFGDIADNPLKPWKWSFGNKETNVAKIYDDLNRQFDTTATIPDETLATETMTTGGGTSIEQARPIDITIDISGNEIAGEDGFRELAVIIRNELESLGVINA